MSKRIVFGLVIVLLAALLVSACAAPPTPTSPTATPKPTPTPTPTSKPHEIVKLDVWYSTPGTSNQILTVALAEIINRNHPWLRLTAAEGGGTSVHLRKLSDDPTLRNHTVFVNNEYSLVAAAKGVPPYEKPYTSARAIAAFQVGWGALWTRDKSITRENLAGKRVMLMPRGNAMTDIHEPLLKKWGVWDQIKVTYGPLETMVSSLVDGLVDVIGPASGATAAPGGTPPWVPSPTTTQLAASRPQMGWINQPVEDLKVVRDQIGPFVIASIPAGTLDKVGVRQPEPVAGSGQSFGWFADTAMDQELVYELTKAIYDYAGQFPDVAGPQGQFVLPQALGLLALPEATFHPGAIKFYREKGIQIGIK